MKRVEELAQEPARATDMLLGKTVVRLVRHQDTEVLVEISDGRRLFVDYRNDGLELSITEGSATKWSHALLPADKRPRFKSPIVD